MTGTAMETPPFKQVAAALRKTTEHLARELVRSSESPPEWNELEWAIARSVAAMQGISALLANKLRWQGPPAWQAFLAEQHEQSLLRDALIGELLQRIDAATRDAGTGCVALKGAALRTLGLYSPGERPMGDVDLLARPADLAGLDVVMRNLGYVEATRVPRHTVYEPRDKRPSKNFGEHVDNALRIEIHPLLAEPLPVSNVDITAQVQPARTRPGLNTYPSLAALLLHLLLHAAGNMRAHTLRQIQLHDIAALTFRLGDADWQALLAAQSAGEKPWWAFPPLALTARYYACGTPPHVLRSLRAYCPSTLRFATARETLTDVSWSNLRIHAFPGIAWSRTPLEALRYVRSRVLPDRGALAEIRATLKNQPQLNDIRWYGLAHGRRIVRWLVSRPPRVQTMLSIGAALKSPERKSAA